MSGKNESQRSTGAAGKVRRTAVDPRSTTIKPEPATPVKSPEDRDLPEEPSPTPATDGTERG